MFVYQNANRDICVTFKSNKPVADPEYVIAIDHEAGTLTVNGQTMVASEEAAEDEVADEAVVEEPAAVEVEEEPSPVEPEAEDDEVEEE